MTEHPPAFTDHENPAQGSGFVILSRSDGGTVGQVSEHTTLSREPAAPELRHPFDIPEVQAIIAAEFPDIDEAIAGATRPRVSVNPDALEQFETEQIMLRRNKLQGESPHGYAMRLIFEDSFSVNQNPKAEPEVIYLGSRGLTTGGLLSHCYTPGRSNGITMPQLAARDELANATFMEALRAAQGDTNLAHGLFYMVYDSTYTGRASIDLLRRLYSGVATPPEALDSVGYRLLRMLRATPAMTEPLQNDSLHRRFVMHDNALRTIPRAELFQTAWRQALSMLENGRFPVAWTD